MECRLNLGKNNGSAALDVTLYKSIIGSLRYLVNTRPDISYTVGILSRFMESPAEQHWAAMKQLLRYVRGTANYGCRYKKGDTEGADAGGVQ
jgi:hypothetical protein